MNQRHLWTTVAAQTIITVAVLGLPSVGRTQTSVGNSLTNQASVTGDAVKVGEYQSLTENPTSNTVITRIHSHSIKGLQAATLYVRDIPVLTFLGSTPVSNKKTKVGVINNNVATNSVKVASSSKTDGKLNLSRQVSSIDNDPVQKASIIAARINKLVENNVDASKITVSWKTGDSSSIHNKPQKPGISVQKQSGDSYNKELRDRYTIKINGQELVEVNEGTRLADTTKNLAQDALQATNRLRRLIGNASPIKEIANLPTGKSLSIPKLSQQIALSGVKLTFQGIASWYGYDWSGNKTASGERYNPDGLTAAHRSLPMGTRIRVTNTRNGRSVVVRINDRGPYIRGRIIDVSAGAARVLGMVGSGLAPVHLEVLGR
ncbi:septal ring lytic transglycosylase RlpA family protein [Anabaena sp. UHCC 0253]|uniref:septal ring lytic transglycosylase RlpA family protein n=1 Tax=Anabaena sp. UHCC 0253 TaxID=2590019 RepID=UPI00144680FD|nr:septal ring lytic transglycosylase RlpA family protein [Anabaena sp. UHCC 0253]MTJ51872.1 septal ring lytic transglycosylase RlpA family protein [Anabaena sp. UHCC 0253]